MSELFLHFPSLLVARYKGAGPMRSHLSVTLYCMLMISYYTSETGLIMNLNVP